MIKSNIITALLVATLTTSSFAQSDSYNTTYKNGTYNCSSINGNNFCFEQRSDAISLSDQITNKEKYVLAVRNKVKEFEAISANTMKIFQKDPMLSELWNSIILSYRSKNHEKNIDYLSFVKILLSESQTKNSIKQPLYYYDFYQSIPILLSYVKRDKLTIYFDYRSNIEIILSDDYEKFIHEKTNNHYSNQSISRLISEILNMQIKQFINTEGLDASDSSVIDLARIFLLGQSSTISSQSNSTVGHFLRINDVSIQEQEIYNDIFLGSSRSVYISENESVPFPSIDRFGNIVIPKRIIDVCKNECIKQVLYHELSHLQSNLTDFTKIAATQFKRLLRLPLIIKKMNGDAKIDAMSQEIDTEMKRFFSITKEKIDPLNEIYHDIFAILQNNGKKEYFEMMRTLIPKKSSRLALVNVYLDRINIEKATDHTRDKVPFIFRPFRIQEKEVSHSIYPIDILEKEFSKIGPLYDIINYMFDLDLLRSDGYKYKREMVTYPQDTVSELEKKSKELIQLYNSESYNGNF
jgi:hypothetical protein